MRLVLAVLALLLVAHASSRAEPLPPDEEVARREYAAGVLAYDHADYTTALLHFTAAKEALHLPALEFNIARCLDRMARWHDAADAYERFVTLEPNAENAGELRARIVELRGRQQVDGDHVAPRVAVMAEGDHAAVAQPRRHPYLLAASVVLGGAVATGVAGGAVYGSAYDDFVKKRTSCGGACSSGDVASITHEVHVREIASDVLWGVAGAALVTDLVLWTLHARHAGAYAELVHGRVTF